MKDKFVIFRHVGFSVEYVFSMSESHVELYINSIKRGEFSEADKYEIYNIETKQSIYIK